MSAPTSDSEARGPLERDRAPDGPRTPGESPAKHDQASQNDPAVMPGAREGNRARRSGEGDAGNPGNRERLDE
ncbi:hypothetical protein [Luteimonas deserti]|uniref:Uncharacterized protein n=1 Tax=Luteimonas deserti TaxID=2752306 RepID=A0A7Z0TWZ2_9GAMM|nr:hypothetical protein [Luteimonas deserti]NYZ63889.1 hypothetical protein [Luteimonas deserti]